MNTPGHINISPEAQPLMRAIAALPSSEDRWSWDAFAGVPRAAVMACAHAGLVQLSTSGAMRLTEQGRLAVSQVARRMLGAALQCRPDDVTRALCAHLTGCRTRVALAEHAQALLARYGRPLRGRVLELLTLEIELAEAFAGAHLAAAPQPIPLEELKAAAAPHRDREAWPWLRQDGEGEEGQP